MSSINTETETVIKKILPYMKRRGYDIEKDFDFETAVNTTSHSCNQRCISAPQTAGYSGISSKRVHLPELSALPR